MKIGFFELEAWEKEILEKAFPHDKLFFASGKLTSTNVKKYKELEVISIFIYSPVNSVILKKMPRLKMIATRSTGFDHIDLEACKERKIIVCNVPTYGENTVAEHTFALILGLSRKLIACIERTKQDCWNLNGLRGFDLRGKTLGVVGGGNIGQHVIRIAKGLEMKVLVFDINKDLQLAKKLGFKYAQMDELLKNSDIITLHVPYNKHTHHLIDAAAFEKMKKGAYLINTSRGPIVDTAALVKALQTKKLAGAGLDVLEGEVELIEERALAAQSFKKCDLTVLVENHILLSMPNVLITPHNAFNTTEALMRILVVTIESINGFKKKKRVNVVK